jgi:hypothetical protein
MCLVKCSVKTEHILTSETLCDSRVYSTMCNVSRNILGILKLCHFSLFFLLYDLKAKFYINIFDHTVYNIAD